MAPLCHMVRAALHRVLPRFRKPRAVGPGYLTAWLLNFSNIITAMGLPLCERKMECMNEKKFTGTGRCGTPVWGDSPPSFMESGSCTQCRYRGETGHTKGKYGTQYLNSTGVTGTGTGSCQKDSKFVVFHPTRVPHRTPVAHDRLWTDHHGCNGARQRSRRQHQGRTARQRQRRRRTGTPRAAGTTEKQPSSTRQQQRWHQDSKHWISLRPRRSMSPW